MVCAGYNQGGKSSCYGDSGGPLVVPKSANDDTAVIYGVISWGAGCALNSYPGVYVRITKYLDWIEKTAGVVPESTEFDEVTELL